MRLLVALVVQRMFCKVHWCSHAQLAAQHNQEQDSKSYRGTANIIHKSRNTHGLLDVIILRKHVCIAYVQYLWMFLAW